MSLPYLVFDMDGVLAEVSESYREAVVQTVRHFTGKTVGHERIQEYKNRGGFNNDWLLAQQLCRDFGVEVPYDTVVEHFCAIFFGPGGDDGLIAREVWLPRPGLLDALAARFSLAIFTGRLQREAAITLRRYAPDIHFSPIIAAEDVRGRQTGTRRSRVDSRSHPLPGDDLRRRHRGRCTLLARRRRAFHWHRCAFQPAPCGAGRAARRRGRRGRARRCQSDRGALAQCAAPRSNE